MSSIIDRLEELEDHFSNVVPLPTNPPISFTAAPPRPSLLRRVRSHIPDKSYKQDTRYGFMVKGAPELQHTIRSIAYIENRSISATVRTLIVLGLRAYGKLASGLTEQQAADTVAEEIASGS